MKTNYDKSLIEVWEWKAQVEADFIKSGMSNFNEFMAEEVQEIIKKYNIKTRKQDMN